MTSRSYRDKESRIPAPIHPRRLVGTSGSSDNGPKPSQLTEGLSVRAGNVPSSSIPNKPLTEGLSVRAGNVPSSSISNKPLTKAPGTHLPGGSQVDRLFLRALNVNLLGKGGFLRTFLNKADVLPDLYEAPESITDLGCGDGTVTRIIHRLCPEWDVFGLDDNIAKLTVARREAQTLLESAGTWRTWQKGDSIEANWSIQDLRFHFFDIHAKSNFLPTNCYGTFPVPGPPDTGSVKGVGAIAITDSMAHNSRVVISTMFLERVTLEVFFDTVDQLLLPRSWNEKVYLLVSNIHPDMSQRCANQGPPKGYVHSITDVVKEAEQRGFQTIGRQVRTTTEDDVKRFGQACRKWIGVQCWYAIAFERKG